MLVRALCLRRLGKKLSAEELKAATPLSGRLQMQASSYGGRDGRGRQVCLLLPVCGRARLDLELFIAEQRIATFDGTKLTLDGFIKQHATRMAYLRNARTLAEHFNRRIDFVDDYYPSWNEFVTISRAAAVITRTLVPKGDITSEDLYVAVGEEFLAEREKYLQQSEMSFQLVVGPEEDVSVFGQLLRVPPVLAYFPGRIVDVVELQELGGFHAVVRRKPGATTTFAFPH